MVFSYSRTLPGAEVPAVTRGPVEMIVYPFGDLEEGGVSVDNGPPGVDARAFRVGEQRLQELGNAATRRRRVHVHHSRAAESIPSAVGNALESLGALRTQQVCEPHERDRVNVNLVQRGQRHFGSSARGAGVLIGKWSSGKRTANVPRRDGIGDCR